MLAHRPISLVFAIAVVVSHFDCMVHHARGAAAEVQPAPHSIPPLSSQPVGCKDETGCICKGALLAAQVHAPSLDLGGWHVLADLVAIDFSSPLVVLDLAPDIPPSPVDTQNPISGRILRAYISSLLI